MEINRYTDRVVLVTGAGSGIGRACAQRLAAEGARVLATDVDEAGLAETAAGNATIDTRRLDVTDEADVDAAIAAIVDAHGKLDVVVNSAGVLRFNHTHETPTVEWDLVLRVNLTGTFLVCRTALPHLLESRGVIVNVASIAGQKGQPWSSAYSASKGGVLALSRSLAVEYAAQGLRCVSVSPGAVDTPIQAEFHLPEGADPHLLYRVMPIGPHGSPDGIAAAVAWMASAEASHFNGADVRIDGATLA